jgi:Plasmid pRiA4b ORF-3-like protein
MRGEVWLHVQVELEGGGGIACDPPPGRIFLVGPRHSFLQLAQAIDDAFARWDVGHLHAFELPDGQRVGPPTDRPPLDLDAPRWLDHRRTKVLRALAPGDAFTYTFDLADAWRHRCVVLGEAVDPLSAYGARPRRPAIVWGWGWIPDQYGRGDRGEPALPARAPRRPNGAARRKQRAAGSRREDQAS